MWNQDPLGLILHQQSKDSCSTPASKDLTFKSACQANSGEINRAEDVNTNLIAERSQTRKQMENNSSEGIVHSELHYKS